MKWSDKFLVNEFTIDSHHKKLIEIISRLESDSPIPKSEFLDTLTELFKYARFHFSYEESEMEKYNYPEKELHIQKHKDFMKEIDAWVDHFNYLPLQVTYSDFSELFEFGVTWLSNHIVITDKNLAKYLNSKK